MSLEWRTDLPTEPGWYIHNLRHQWVLRTKQVKQGDWHLTQNPEWMYAEAEALISSNDKVQGWWFGPLPEVPK